MLCRHGRKGGASDSRRSGGLAKLQRWAFEALALAPRIPSTCRRSPPAPSNRQVLWPWGFNNASLLTRLFSVPSSSQCHF